MSLDLGEFLPEGMKKPLAKAAKVSLTEFLEKGPDLEPEIFSDPLAVEIHLCNTKCRCGQEFLAPEGVFVEVKLKKLHMVGFNHYYKDVGSVLIPISAARPKKLATIPHRTRTRETTTPLCHMCAEQMELYKDSSIETQEEWLMKRPPVLSEAWRKIQLEVNPSRERLQELIQQIEARERYKDNDEKIVIFPQESCDPESQEEK